MATKTQHEIKSAALVISEDATCQSFIQSSSTLTYACLLIRQKKYELATHVLHSLEAKQASRFKDMVFYLQAQIGIETGEYGTVKKWLMNKVNQQPNNLTALSLLESCIHLEWIEWQSTEGAKPVISGNEPDFISEVGDDALPLSPMVAESEISSSPQGFVVSSVVGTALPVNTPLATVTDPTDRDFGIYQALVNDDNTQALSLRTSETGKVKSHFRNKNLEAFIHQLPQILPGPISQSCSALEGGSIQKLCFSFEKLTVTSFHNGEEQLSLVTGNINQSLLTMVRAENLFQKQAASARSRQAAMVPSSNSVESFGSASGINSAAEVSVNE